MTDTTQAEQIDRVIYRAELCKEMHVVSDTMRRWIKAGKLPQPDVALSQRTMGWRLSTLHAAGIRIVDPVSPGLQHPAADGVSATVSPSDADPRLLKLAQEQAQSGNGI